MLGIGKSYMKDTRSHALNMGRADFFYTIDSSAVMLVVVLLLMSGCGAKKKYLKKRCGLIRASRG